MGRVREMPGCGKKVTTGCGREQGGEKWGITKRSRNGHTYLGLSLMYHLIVQVRCILRSASFWFCLCLYELLKLLKFADVLHCSGSCPPHEDRRRWGVCGCVEWWRGWFMERRNGLCGPNARVSSDWAGAPGPEIGAQNHYTLRITFNQSVSRMLGK